LDRLRGNRTSRDGDGCNDGCNPPCPNSGCTSCGNGSMMYQAAPMQAPTQAAPTVVPESTEGSVIVPTAEGAWYTPSVDPTAFVIRGN
jgi:hypothetical protein